jgi:hypothetical protein
MSDAEIRRMTQAEELRVRFAIRHRLR